MSIWLFSGINGSGKTLNAIRVVLTDPKFAILDDDGKEVGRRPVYQFGINECKLPWQELDADGVRDWRSLPAGSVIFVDECWRVFPSRPGNQAPPPHVAELAEHRKFGFDFVMISQRGIGQVDAFLRGLVERHFHLERLYGTDRVRCFQWEKACDNVNDYHQRKEATSSQWKLDKKYFDAYKSAELHTIKRRLPWKRLALIACLPVLLCVFAWVAWSALRGFGQPAEVAGVSLPVSDFAGGGPYVEPVESLESWSAKQSPRIAGMAWTAPQYDELMRPQSVPLPAGCIVSASGRCACGTWQGTPLDVDPQLCRQIAEHGFFDHTKPRPDPEENRRRDARRPGSPPAQVEASGGGFAAFIPLGSGEISTAGDEYGPGPGRSIGSGLNAGSALPGGGGSGGGGGGSSGESRSGSLLPSPRF